MDPEVRRSPEIQRLVGEAQVAFQEGRLHEADALCRRIMAADPENLDALFMLGMLAARARELEVAVKIFNRLLSFAPDHFDALNWISILIWQLGQPEQALPFARRALAIHPEKAEGHNNLALCHLSMGRYDEAAASFEKAATIWPDNPQIQRNFAVALQNMGREVDAMRCYRRAASLEPNDLESRLAIAEISMRQRDYSGALATAREAVQIAPGSAVARLVLAQALTANQLDEEVEFHLRQAVTLDPMNAEAHSFLGLRQQVEGSFREAKETLKRSVELNSRLGRTYFGLVQDPVTDADLHLVEKMEFLARNGRLPPHELAFVEYALGKAYGDLGRYDLSMSHYDAANRLGKAQMDARKPFNREGYRTGVDRLIARFTSEFVECHLSDGNPSKRPIFIVGMMRSGTTLVEQIVSSHPQVTAGGELRYWLQNGPTSLSQAQPAQVPGILGDLADRYLQVLNGIDPGSAHVTDKMPQNFQVLGPISLTFPNSTIIHIRRNPVDTALSIYTTPYSVPPEYAYDMGNIVFAYRQYLRIMEHWRSVLPPGRFLEIDYEELVGNGEEVTRRMIAYCGLEWDEACLRPEFNLRTVTTPSLWQVRQPIYQGSVERWRRYEPWLGELRELAES